MSILGMFQWLADTSGSVALHESVWGYPLVESVHVLGLCLFVGMAAILDLRLLGVLMNDQPVSGVAKQLLPWTITGFVIMVATGLALFYAIPVRAYQNVFFRLKMILLVLAGLNAYLFHSGVYRQVGEWDRDRRLPRKARFAGAASLVLWACIIIAGRFIAYNWFDCDKPQTPSVRWLAGCGETVK